MGKERYGYRSVEVAGARDVDHSPGNGSRPGGYFHCDEISLEISQVFLLRMGRLVTAVPAA